MRRRSTAILLVIVWTLSIIAGIVGITDTVQASKAVDTKQAGSTMTTLVVHYQREDRNYEGWNLWVWEDNKVGKEIRFSTEDDFGKIAVYQTENELQEFGFLIRLNDWEKKDVDLDRKVEPVDGVAEIWLISGQEEVVTIPPVGYTSYDWQDALYEKEHPTADENSNLLTIHYHRFDSYDDWNLWIWQPGEEGDSYPFQTEDGYGKVSTVVIPNSCDTVGFVVRRGQWEEKDVSTDRVIDMTECKDGKLEVYLVQGDDTVYYEKDSVDLSPKILNATFPSSKEVEFSVNVPVNTGDKNLKDQFQVIDEDGKSYPIMKIWSKELGSVNSASIILEEKLDLTHRYKVFLNGYREAEINLEGAFSTTEFTEQFTYEGDDLGQTYSKEKTVLRLWAPTATKVEVNLFEAGVGGSKLETLPMDKDVKGTWVVTLEGDQNGVYYTYSVTSNGEVREAVAPYARTTGVNGERGMILDLSSTDPEGFVDEERPNTGSITDTVLYEMHLRDYTVDSNSGIAKKGRYLGLTETGTTNVEGDATGLDHLRELGITHVDFLPIFDFASIDESNLTENSYNWGYTPKNYNVPEGSYSTDPFHGEVRVQELKKMVQSLHSNGIGVVMDVAYSHTASSMDSSFNGIVPGYFYRIKNGTYSDGSGYGNEIATERAMVRKYIVDSVVYWAKEYHIDGFRFEQMGLIDIETMNAVREALDKVDPSILMYGDGWTAGTSALAEVLRAEKLNTQLLNHIACLNDDFRDGIKGSVFNVSEGGFINGWYGQEDSIEFGVVGAIENDQINNTKLKYSEEAWAANPVQSINYVSSHLNMTLWDKISSTACDEPEDSRIQMNKLAAAIVMTSQGAPFFQAGEEFLRSKPSSSLSGVFDRHSEESPDSTNAIRWSNKSAYQEVNAYYQGLIAFRKAHGSLRLTTSEEVSERLIFSNTGYDNVVAYQIREDDTTLNSKDNGMEERLYVIYNGNKDEIHLPLPSGEWQVYIDGANAGNDVLYTIMDNQVEVAPTSCMVLVQKYKEAEDGKEQQQFIQEEKKMDSASAVAWILLAWGIFLLLLHSRAAEKVKSYLSRKNN